MLARCLMNYNIQKANDLIEKYGWIAEFTYSSIILRWPNGAVEFTADFNNIMPNINKS